MMSCSGLSIPPRLSVAPRLGTPGSGGWPPPLSHAGALGPMVSGGVSGSAPGPLGGWSEPGCQRAAGDWNENGSDCGPGGGPLEEVAGVPLAPPLLDRPKPGAADDAVKVDPSGACAFVGSSSALPAASACGAGAGAKGLGAKGFSEDSPGLELGVIEGVPMPVPDALDCGLMLVRSRCDPSLEVAPRLQAPCLEGSEAAMGREDPEPGACRPCFSSRGPGESASADSPEDAMVGSCPRPIPGWLLGGIDAVGGCREPMDSGAATGRRSS
mmetsp:Transcript_68406/g.178085  ORF Transcript_68406/g.178085 Transcript_68406/m.178085 type:complete len:270 (+) Transcript_68406:1336-2145(+)